MVAGTLLLMIAAAPPLMAAPGGIRRVTLSSGGLAEVTAVHPVDGSATLAIDVRADQVDDILKSLVVRDPGGAVGGIRLDGVDQLDETLRTMPFSADDLSSPVRLLGKLQGVPVKVQSAGRTLDGKVLGVAERDAGTETGPVRVLSVLTETGTLESLPIDDGAAVTIRDPAVMARIAEAVAASGKSKAGGAHRVEVAVTGSGRREVRLTYVVAAPVWKTSYRVVDGGKGRANLQAWAVIENALGGDWQGVDVTLSSGSPVTLRQRLHQRYWRERPEAPIPIEGVGMPDLDPGTVAAKSLAAESLARPRAAAGAAPMPAPMMAAGPPAMASRAPEPTYEAAPAAVAAGAAERDVSATFTLPHPVDLETGRTLSVPIIDTEVEAERIALWRPGQGPHPIAALMIRNGSTATLPPGLATVYDREAGYVGDARLPSIPVGEQRFASFAADRKISVQGDSTPSAPLTQVTVSGGVARTTVTQREVTTYTVKGAPDAARAVIIEHPRRRGWTFTSAARDSETPDAYRLRAAVPAGGTAEIRAVLEQVRVDTTGLVDADEALLVSWSSLATDPRLAAKFKDLAAARAEIDRAEGEVAAFGERSARITSAQERIRGNLGAVPKDSELARRYLALMGEQEDELARIEAGRTKAAGRLDALRAKLKAMIAAF